MDYIIPKEYAPLFYYTHQPYPDYRYYDFSGGRSSGKSTTVALAITLLATQRTTRILCCREYQNSIKDSVKALIEQIITDNQLPGYTILNDTIIHQNGSQFIFKGLHDNTEATIKSLHNINICWVEEAQTISKQSLDILLPTIRTTHSIIIYTRNPLTPTDEITLRHVTNPTPETAKRTYHKHVTYRILERAGILPTEIKHQIQEAKNTPDYNHIWEGQPTQNLTNQLITWQQLQQTEHNPQQPGGTTLGIDVARYGNDRTAIATIQGNTLTNLTTWQHASITQSAQRIKTICSTQPNLTSIKIDDTGVGGGLTDILTDSGLPIQPINFGSKPTQPKKYDTTISEMWFTFKQKLPTIRINPQLTTKNELYTELTNREWTIDNQNRRAIQKKRDYKHQQQTGSPDLADAVLLAYYQPKRFHWNVSV